MEKSKVTETAIWAFAIWAFAVVLLILWQLVPSKHTGWEVFNQVVSVVAAAGTVGAVVWAMRSSFAQQQEQARRDKEAAIILAAGLSDLLKHANARLYQTILTIDFSEVSEVVADELNLPPNDQQLRQQAQEGRSALLSALKGPAFSHGFSTISKLAPLPNNCATRFYKARSMIKALVHEIEVQNSGDDWKLLHGQDRMLMLRMWSSRATEASKYSMQVANDIDVIVRDAGIDLTDEELYGSDSGRDFSDQD